MLIRALNTGNLTLIIQQLSFLPKGHHKRDLLYEKLHRKYSRNRNWGKF